MFTSEQTHPVNVSVYSLAALALAGALVLAGCDSNDTTDSQAQIASVAISPDSVNIAVGESVDFSVVALTASGDTIRDADLDFTWESTDPGVFTVEDDGVATGQDSGTAFCTVEANTEETITDVTISSLRFVGRDSAFVEIF